MTTKSNLEPCHLPLRILIAGAGIAGLSTAISLGRRGHSVVVLESTKEKTSSQKATQHVAKQKASKSDAGTQERDHTSSIPPEKRMIPILHADLKAALTTRAAEMDNVDIRFGAPVASVETGSHAEVTLDSGERIPGDLIIVADGVGSNLKWSVSPAELERAQPTGDAAYRLILPRELLEGDEELLPLIQHPWAKRWDGPKGIVMAYPIHNFELLNMVLLHPDENAEESWNSTTEKRHLIEDFKSWNEVVKKLIGLAPDMVPNFRVLTHSPSSTWVKGSVMLLGDACHAMPPYLGQGVAQAVEDAIAITSVLSLIKTRAQLPAALQAYETSRKTRVLEMQAATRQAQQFAYRKGKDGERNGNGAGNKEEEDKVEAKKSDDLIKVMRSSWAYDAKEAAERALFALLPDI